MRQINVLIYLQRGITGKTVISYEIVRINNVEIKDQWQDTWDFLPCVWSRKFPNRYRMFSMFTVRGNIGKGYHF